MNEKLGCDMNMYSTVYTVWETSVCTSTLLLGHISYCVEAL